MKNNIYFGILRFLATEEQPLTGRVLLMEVRGGLGNQLLEYIFARYMASSMNAKLVLNIAPVLAYDFRYTKRDFLLDSFNVKYHSKISSQWRRLALKYLLRLTSSYHQVLEFCRIGEDYFRDKDFVYFVGLPSSSRFFEIYKKNPRFLAEIAQELTLKESPYTPILDDILSTASCSLHIRRGDYLQARYSKIKESSKEYYLAAIDKMRERVPEVKFFCFSDDIVWCRENLSHIPNITFVDSGEIDTVRDFYLMSKCKHNIISNSTLSFTASFCNTNDSKIMIAPEPIYDDRAMNEGYSFTDGRYIRIPKGSGDE